MTRRQLRWLGVSVVLTSSVFEEACSSGRTADTRAHDSCDRLSTNERRDSGTATRWPSYVSDAIRLLHSVSSTLSTIPRHERREGTALVGRSRGGLLADPAGLRLFDIRLNIFVKQEPLATETPRGMRYLLHVPPMGGVPFFD